MRTHSHRTPLLLLLAALFLHGAAAQSLRFAWLSDTHVGGATGASDLRATVDDIRSLPDLEFVILSGDITEFGSDEQLARAHQILDSLPIPYHIVPGNHDTKWSESGGTTFPRLWGSDRFVFSAGGYRFIGMHQGPRMRMADGHWAPEDVRWLDSVLVEEDRNGHPIIFVTHYPIDSSIANWFEVLDRLKRHDVRFVMVGHGHRNRVELYEGLPAAMGRSNLRGRGESGGYTIAEIRNDTLLLSERNPGRTTGRPWLVHPLRPGPFAPDSLRWPRPSFAMNLQHPDVNVVWEHRTGFTVAAGPASDGKNVIVGDASGRVTCLDLLSGRVRWTALTGGPILSAPSISEGVAVIGSTDGGIRAYNVEDGRLLWRFTAGGPVLGVPAISEGTVFIGASDRKMRALGLSDGKEIWNYSGLTGFVETKPLIHFGKVFFGAWDTHLYALDEKSGQLVWRWTGPGGTLLSPAACWPVAIESTLVIVAPDRKMTALNAGTGDEFWHTARYQVRESIGKSTSGDLVFARLMRDTLLAFNLSAQGPLMRWITKLDFGYDINAAMPVEEGGTLFYGTKNGVLYALRSGTGEMLWKYRLGVGTLHTVAAIDASSVVTTDFDGVVRFVRWSPNSAP